MKTKLSPFVYRLNVEWTELVRINDFAGLKRNILINLKGLWPSAKILEEERELPNDPEEIFVAIAAGDNFLVEIGQTGLEINTKFSVRNGIDVNVLGQVLGVLLKMPEYKEQQTDKFTIGGIGFIESPSKSKHFISDVQKQIFAPAYSEARGFEATFFDVEEIAGHLLNTEKRITSVRDNEEYALRLDVNYLHKTRRGIGLERLIEVVKELISDHDILESDSAKLVGGESLSKKDGKA